MKVYRARSEIAVNVRVGPEGAKRHVVFMARYGGGSILATGDVELQNALESHPKFGKLFVLESDTGESAKPAPAAKSQKPSKPVRKS